MPGPGWLDSRATAKTVPRIPWRASMRRSRSTSRSIAKVCCCWIWMLDWLAINASSWIENRTKRRMKTAVRRTVVVRQSWANLFTDHISGAADGVEQRIGVPFVDLAAQARHVHVDDVGLWIEMIIPDIFEQQNAGHN